MKTLAATLLVGMVVICGCNTPPKDPPADVSVGTPAASGSAPAAPASAPTPTPTPTVSVVPSASAAPTPSTSTSTTKPGKGCASDADCRTYSSYCAEAPCACRVLAKTDGDPKCLGSGPKVQCFADPCMNKSARCDSGTCVLNAKARGATEK